MSHFKTLTAFFEQTDTELRVFDMARRVVRIPRNDFVAFEEGRAPYPYPYLRQAWFAMLFWGRERPEERLIWFLRFPLDEQGQLVDSTRDEFLHQVVQLIGERIQQAGEDEQVGNQLEQSPFTFRPREDRLAVFHAKASQALDQPPSKYYDHARDYLSGQLGWDQWSFVGMQGLADCAARLNQDDNDRRIAQAIPELPHMPLQTLAQCLENERVSDGIAQALSQRLQTLLAEATPDLRSCAACLRGLARAQRTELRNGAVATVLQSTQGQDPQLLAAIGGRLWESLEDDALRHQFMECLAENNGGQAFFNESVADLVAIPAVRPKMLQEFRNPDRSAALGAALDALFQGVKG